MNAEQVFVGVAIDRDGFNPCESVTRSVDEVEEEFAEPCTHIDAATYRLLRATGL